MPAKTKPKKKPTTTPGPKDKPTWYKVLERGRSFHGGTLKWSLPTKDGQPGDWHEVDGPLVRCKNGLHLTDEPLRLRPRTNARTVVCYEAEYDGDFLPPQDHELVVRRCRLMRVVPWETFAPSAAMELLRLVWKTEGKAKGGHSWRRLNDAMRTALYLAIDAGMAWNPGDVRRIYADFNAGYWLDLESAYVHACGESRGSLGPNPSAIAAIEFHLGRKPFLLAREAKPGAPKDRLCVGKNIWWHVDFKKCVRAEVTSFAADQSSLIACTYKERDTASYERKIDRRFTITHEDIANYHKAIREFAQQPPPAPAQESAS